MLVNQLNILLKFKCEKQHWLGGWGWQISWKNVSVLILALEKLGVHIIFARIVVQTSKFSRAEHDASKWTATMRIDHDKRNEWLKTRLRNFCCDFCSAISIWCMWKISYKCSEYSLVHTSYFVGDFVFLMVQMSELAHKSIESFFRSKQF
jgi:hypothetical protein